MDPLWLSGQGSRVRGPPRERQAWVGSSLAQGSGVWGRGSGLGVRGPPREGQTLVGFSLAQGSGVKGQGSAQRRAGLGWILSGSRVRGQGSVIRVRGQGSAQRKAGLGWILSDSVVTYSGVSRSFPEIHYYAVQWSGEWHYFTLIARRLVACLLNALGKCHCISGTDLLNVLATF